MSETKANDCTESCGGCPLAGLCGDPLPGTVVDHIRPLVESGDGEIPNLRYVSPVCVQTSTGRVPCGRTDICTSPEADMVARLADVLANADTPAAPGERVSYEALALEVLVHLDLLWTPPTH